MMQCPNCQHDNRAGAKFCDRCETGLGENTGTTEAETITPESETWRSYDVSDGLPAGAMCLFQDVTGYLWIGTDGGVSRYDGQLHHGRAFVNFTTDDGLAHDSVVSIYQDRSGNLWFGTDGGGVSCYDGMCWVSLDTRDGLAGNSVFAIHQEPDGSMWFGTEGGITRYRRNDTKPQVQILSITTDATYPIGQDVPEATMGSRVTIAYSALDFNTLPEKRQYRCRIGGVDSTWRSASGATTFEHIFQEAGTYTFQVQAIDRHLNYSEPATLTLRIVPPFYLRGAFLLPTIGGGSILLAVAIVASVTALRRRRQVHAYELLAVQELQDARQMQMSLMPEHCPTIQGAEIAGKCVTANTVGGDFFAYLPGNHPGEVCLVVADVSGHAMKGAMNAVMTDGILHMAVKEKGSASPAALLQEVNDVLSFRIESDMNVTMAIAVVNTDSRTVTIANAAHHAYPLLVRDGEVISLKSRGLPLGMRAGVEYREETFNLQCGDILVLMTDGIIEAHDADGRMYGESGRLEQVLTGFTQHMTAEGMVDAVIQDAIEYSAGNREDDATVVVAKMV